MKMEGKPLQVLGIILGTVALHQYTQYRKTQVNKTLEESKAKLNAAVSKTNGKNHKNMIVEIEYCTGCRWMLRAAWMAQELLNTFQTDAECKLRSIVLTPNSSKGGVFQVYLYEEIDGTQGEREMLWCRKLAGRFPESKELKQLVRDFVSPEKDLGHSDKK